jgi:hypothetical protein
LNPDVRNAVLGAGLAFCILFGGATLVAVAESGPSGRGLFLGGISLAIIGLIGFGLYGAMRNPPGE